MFPAVTESRKKKSYAVSLMYSLTRLTVLAQALSLSLKRKFISTCLIAFYVYFQAKIGKEEILKLTIQYIRKQKGKQFLRSVSVEDNCK